MASTFSQIYLQFVFAVRDRRNLIPKQHKEDLHKFLTGLVQNRKTKMLAINCMPDHTHIFVGFKPSVLISEFVKEIKVESNEFVNDSKWNQGKFSWQEGYGVFSYSRSQLDSVINYVYNQEANHKIATFREEYYMLLKEFGIDYKEEYLFDFFS